MSVNLNSNIIKAIQPQVERNAISYNFDANVYAIAGGAGGETGAGGNLGKGAGGGAGAVVSSSLSVVPNITWTINVGGGGNADTSGQNTTAIAYDGDYSGLVTFKAQGGFTGVSGVGGNSGTGSVETTAVTSSYSAFTGGANTTAGGTNAAGGGAGVTANGLTGVPYDGNPGTGEGGNGGQGISNFLSVSPGIGGGGSGAGEFSGGTAYHGGGVGSPDSPRNASQFGAGGGGGNGPSDAAGTGYKGAVIITFAGKIGTALNEYDIELTNATVEYAGGGTKITFNSGSGTFRYNAPYPYVPGN